MSNPAIRKLTPPQKLAKIKQLCLDYYGFTDHDLATRPPWDTKSKTLCRYVIVAAGMLTTTYTGSYMCNFAGYGRNGYATLVMQKYHADKDFKKEVDKIINQL